MLCKVKHSIFPSLFLVMNIIKSFLLSNGSLSLLFDGNSLFVFPSIDENIVTDSTSHI